MKKITEQNAAKYTLVLIIVTFFVRLLIAAYTGLIKLAGKLGLKKITELLSETLDEEVEADVLLGEMADNDIIVDEEKAR